MATYITITGQYQGITGQPGAGWVRFTPVPALRVPGSAISEGYTRVTLDGTGAFAVPLLANTDPTVQPAGSYYVVSEAVNGRRREYAVRVPHDAGATLALSSLPAVEG